MRVRLWLRLWVSVRVRFWVRVRVWVRVSAVGTNERHLHDVFMQHLNGTVPGGFDILSYIKRGIGRHGDSLGHRETFETPGMQDLRVVRARARARWGWVA